jgi:hypothetical protein
MRLPLIVWFWSEAKQSHLHSAKRHDNILGSPFLVREGGQGVRLPRASPKELLMIPIFASFQSEAKELPGLFPSAKFAL